jgi:hypothetical protein
MATAYTSLLGLALPVTGELSGTWGDTVNTSITSLVDSAVAGTTSLTTDADVTLTSTTGSANQARQAILLCTGARAAQRTITAPALSKTYVLINATTGGFGVKIVGAGPTTGVVIPNGFRALVAWTGSDFAIVGLKNAAAVTTVPYGGTGVSTLTGIVKGNGASNFSAATAGTDYLVPPAGTALLKANSGGALANATAGTDYLAPPAGTAILKANSGGALANATAGTDYVAPATATNFTATQRASTGTASVSTTSTYSFAGAAQVTTVTLTNAITVTFGAPSGMVAGAYYTLVLTAGGTGARTFAWNAAWKFPAAVPPLTSGTTTSGASDVISFVALSATTAAYVGHQADLR